MSLWSRLVNIFQTEKLTRDIDEELQSHLAEAIAQGRDPAEARKSFGSPLRHRETSRDLRLSSRLDSLRSDIIFGWRQLAKKPATTIAAVLSIALAIGSCTAVFRLVDALLLRPMPIAHPERLYAMIQRGVGPSGEIRDGEYTEYPQFAAMRAAVKDDAELIAAGGADRTDLTFSSDDEMEKAQVQFVSGWLFPSFGLKPAVGRLFTEDDDRTPKAKPYAVLSYDFWNRRFGADPKILGHTFKLGSDVYQIIGVASDGFTGTEPGTFTDIFIPCMMYAGVTHDDWGWVRAYIHLKPNGNTERVRDRLQTIWTTTQTERAKSFTNWPPNRIKQFLQQRIVVEPAASGLSYMRELYKVALSALAVIVALVLFIACANVANLLTGQAAARAREMALRVSIGAGKGRLIQMVLAESALLAFMATVVGALFAWWSAPFIVSMINPPDNPARLALPADWRVMAFAAGLSVGVTFLFGLVPAIRASLVQPASALKGGDDPHSRRHLMFALIAAQVAFCFVVHFAAGAFISTLRHLADQPTGFSSERLLTLQTVSKQPQPTEFWYQTADHLRSLPGIENVSIAGWALLSGNGMNSFVSVNGAPPGPILGYFLNVSPGWLDTMKIALLDGRDFRPTDRDPGAAIINQAFAKEYFHEIDPLGKSFSRGKKTYQVIGLVRDARYRNLREPITPTAYVPLRYPPPESLSGATFLVKTINPNPLALVPTLRREIARAHPEFRVSNARTQAELNAAQTIRERLLAALAVFFAGVAVLLSGIGLYGVLDYSVLQRRRELGIRIAIGAPATNIVREVTLGIFAMVCLGALSGIALGFLLAPHVKTLLYQVKPTDPTVLTLPLVIIALASTLAALPSIWRALRIDPVTMLRAE